MTDFQSTSNAVDGVCESPVSFTVGGSEVRGILCTPEKSSPTKAVVFSHGWSGNRNGPAGILTKASRALAVQGCACLRFDFRGRGESGGDGLNASLATMSEDLKAAVKKIEEISGISDPAVFGMCSGGNIAIGSLKELPEVKNIVLLSVYPFSDGDSFGRDVHRTWHFLNVYLHKACSMDTWRRLFKGEASLGRVFGVIFRPFLKRGENKVKEEGVKKSQTAKASNNESRLQAGKEPPKKYLANLRKDLQGLMVYGSADPDASSAFDYYSKYVEQEKLPIRFERIDGANHNFSSLSWQKRIVELACDFLK